MRYFFGFACNDGDTGTRQDFIEAADFEMGDETVISWSSEWFPSRICAGGYERTKDGSLGFRVSRRVFPIIAYGSGGNWCWERIEVSRTTAVEILNYIAALRGFSCDEAHQEFFDWWQNAVRPKLTEHDVLRMFFGPRLQPTPSPTKGSTTESAGEGGA